MKRTLDVRYLIRLIMLWLLWVLTVNSVTIFAARNPAVPTPESMLGKKPGDDFYLAGYTESLAYFRKLAEASDRVQLLEVGKTSFGKDWYLALISSPENLAALEKYKAAAGRLAQARNLSDPEARQLARESKTIVHIDGGLHATEVAHAQHTIQLAYQLAATTDNPQVDRILDNVILLLWFSINPDGQDMVASWYQKNLGTPYEVSPLPWLYQKYVGHDNNRDGYMNNMLESQVITRTILKWNPQVIYNHHQTAPFPARIWIPPFAEPVSSNVSPLMWRWVNLFGTSMAAYLEERNLPGAIHRGRGFDDWYPGFLDHVNSFRNTVSFLTETALYRYATPHFYTVSDFPKDRQDLRAESLYASPWKGGWWRLGDAVRYMLEASMSVLDTAAKYRENLLFNRYQAGRSTIEYFQKEPPFAYVIPQNQFDGQTAALLVDKLLVNGIEIHQADRPFTLENRGYSAGDWVILMDQPFANLVKELFEIQSYPDLRDFPDGPPDLPYDVAGWTLPLQMGVEATAIQSPVDETVRQSLKQVREAVPSPGAIQGSGSFFRLSRRSNRSYEAVNKLLSEGGKASVMSEPASGAGALPKDWFLVGGIDSGRLREVAERYRLRLEATSLRPEAVELRAPRVGLYRPWTASIDEGWTRWLLENYGFQLESLYNADVVAGRLNERFDAIVIPDMSTRSILEGHKPGTIPGQYAGGIGRTGVDALRQFVLSGGTLIAFNKASEFAVQQLNLPVKNVVEGLKSDEFFCSGSLLIVELNSEEHPIKGGMPDRAGVMFHRGPVFEVQPGFQGSILATYPEDRDPLLSGYILHPEKLQGKAALLDVRHGKGHVILFGFKPQWRGQTHGTFKLFFNSLYIRGDHFDREGEAEESAQVIDIEIWNRIKKRVHSDLDQLVEQLAGYSQARGSRALREQRKLNALIQQFQERHASELERLEKARTAREEKQLLSAYRSQLRNLLVDLSGKDTSVVTFTAKDLQSQYRLREIEMEIDSALAKIR